MEELKKDEKSIEFRPWKIHGNNPLYQIYTVKEAADVWGIPLSTIQAELIGRRGGYTSKFREDEVRQSGSIWLITEKGINRVFGHKYYKKESTDNSVEE